MAFSSDGSAFTKVDLGSSANKLGSFSRITDVHEEQSSALASSSSVTQGAFGRSSIYSVSSMKTTQNTTSSVFKSDLITSSSKKVRTVTSTKTVTKKQIKTIPTSEQNTANSKDSGKADTLSKDTQTDDDIRKEVQLPSTSHIHDLAGGSFFKAKFKPDLGEEDFFRSANSRFSMRNLNDTSGLWNFDLDEGASLFPDFFPKNDAATKLAFEATWRAVSPTKEFGLAKQAIKNCAWEDEESRDEDKKKIVNSWMQFFGHINTVKDG